LIRKISTDGIVTTIAGALTESNKNHPEDTTRLDSPKGIAADKQGNVYFTDFGRDVIRKISADGKIRVFAGSGNRGAKDGRGTAASFYLPTGLAIDDRGNLFVADTYNNIIRKIDPNGMVTTIAGKPAPQGKRNGGAKDDKGPQAQFRHPFGVVVDHNDNVYVADVGNQKIRKISPDGIVTTAAGTGRRGADNGDASKASFYNPYGVAVYKQGNLYIADYQNNVVRKLSF
jgi:streptogramin lyase